MYIHMYIHNIRNYNLYRITYSDCKPLPRTYMYIPTRTSH